MENWISVMMETVSVAATSILFLNFCVQIHGSGGKLLSIAQLIEGFFFFFFFCRVLGYSWNISSIFQVILWELFYIFVGKSPSIFEKFLKSLHWKNFYKREGWHEERASNYRKTVERFEGMGKLACAAAAQARENWELEDNDLSWGYLNNDILT